MEIPFQRLTLQDRQWVLPLLEQENSRSADYNFTNLYIWNDAYPQEAALVDGCLAVRLWQGGSPYYFYPVGGGEAAPVLQALREDAAHFGAALRLCGVLRHHVEVLNFLCPEAFNLTEDRKLYDYIYSADKLDSLSGKKLASKRNHINRFVENYPDWSFEPLTAAGLDECTEFTRIWAAEGHTGAAQMEMERIALHRAFDGYDALMLEGGVLRAGGQMLGYTIGERLNSDTFVVHFEKSLADVQGAYAILNREFVRHIRKKYPGIIYINREDDMGLPNIRKAKSSYHPEFLVEKYTAQWKELP